MQKQERKDQRTKAKKILRSEAALKSEASSTSSSSDEGSSLDCKTASSSGTESSTGAETDIEDSLTSEAEIDRCGAQSPVNENVGEKWVAVKGQASLSTEA